MFDDVLYNRKEVHVQQQYNNNNDSIALPNSSAALSRRKHIFPREAAQSYVSLHIYVGLAGMVWKPNPGQKIEFYSNYPTYKTRVY
jgi:hypothetical protein